MRFSKLFAPTTKEAPKDATLPSHIYLLRGGFISQVGAGIYNFMPLGKIILDKIRNIVKEELDRAGCQETLLGFVTPIELWVESGRVEKFGKELLRFKDRKDNNFILGPTHEEMMVELVKNRVKSYKQLPLNLYQINTKFRDEARPRFGLLRAREFIMKDGYSFHETTEDMQREYALMEKTYSRIIKRLGLEFRVVEADSGAIGGSGSKEFMVLADNGEDDIVICSNCNYSANIEASKRVKKEAPKDEVEMSYGEFFTPNVKTIEELSQFFYIDSYYLLKTIAKKAIFEDREEIILFFIRGCDTLQETKALNAVGAIELVDVTEEELEKEGLIPGFIGASIKGFRKIVDSELREDKKLITGANRKDYHIVGFNISNLKDVEFKDLIEVQKGDKCIKCGGELNITKGIEVGHIFQLGDRYSKPLDATFLDRNGKSKPFVMGTYGIGISRLIAVVVEQSHDEKGIIWTKETAPFQLDIIISNIKDKEQKSFGEELYQKLKEKNKEILLDDRNERFGFKIKDFELIGFPYGLIIGKKLKEGIVEIVDRKTLEKREIKKEEVFEEILRLI